MGKLPYREVQTKYRTQIYTYFKANDNPEFLNVIVLLPPLGSEGDQEPIWHHSSKVDEI